MLQSAKQKGETYLEKTIAIHFAGSGDAAERRPVRGGGNGVAADGRTMSKGYDAKGVTAKAFAVVSSSVTG